MTPLKIKMDGVSMSQSEIKNINILLNTLKKTWIYQTPGYSPSHEYVTKLIMHTISHINGVPMITFCSLADAEFVEKFHTLITDGAFGLWLAHTAIGLDKEIPTFSEAMGVFDNPRDPVYGVGMSKQITVDPQMGEWLERVKQVKADRE